MIINSDKLNTVANITNLGLVTALLNYNEYNYQINKDNYEINKKLLEANNNRELLETLNNIYGEMKGIREDLDIIIERMECDKDEINRKADL